MLESILKLVGAVHLIVYAIMGIMLVAMQVIEWLRPRINFFYWFQLYLRDKSDRKDEALQLRKEANIRQEASQ